LGEWAVIAWGYDGEISVHILDSLVREDAKTPSVHHSTPIMPRPILATVHTAALRHNLDRARRAAVDARVWAVVKANAYGHGIERVYEGLRGADGFALLDLAEAERVRALGWRGPVLLLEGVFDARDLELCSRLDLWHTVHCDEQIDLATSTRVSGPISGPMRSATPASAGAFTAITTRS